MDALVAEIRKKAKGLLERKEVKRVLGFTRGNLPMVTRPFIARSPEDADLLWWDDFCVMNLAAFLPQNHDGKTGVIMKACDMRNLVILNLEKQIDLTDDLVILGVPCHGMVDAEKIWQQISPGEPVKSVEVSASNIEIQGQTESRSLVRPDFLRDSCLTCNHTAPEIVDEWIVESEGEGIKTEKTEISTKPVQSGDLGYFKDLFSACIRCYACREACPSCYCKTCFVDKAGHLWQGPGTQAEKDVLDFHFFRSFHLLGRCTDCGACESACPVNIPVRQLVLHLRQGNETFKEYEPGLNPSLAPPVACFCPAIHEHRK